MFVYFDSKLQLSKLSFFKDTKVKLKFINVMFGNFCLLCLQRVNRTMQVWTDASRAKLWFHKLNKSSSFATQMWAQSTTGLIGHP